MRTVFELKKNRVIVCIVCCNKRGERGRKREQRERQTEKYRQIETGMFK